MDRLSAQPLSYEINGLSRKQVEQSRREHGENNFTKKKRAGFFKQFLASFGDPIIRILLAALFINVLFLFESKNWFETIGIALAVFLATFISTLSEYGSESAFAKLQEDAAKIQCRVKRAEGVLSLPITELVVGDLVLLEAGERLPADGILITGKLLVDQSALNGESKEMTKTPEKSMQTEWDLHAKNQLFRGSIATSGEGIMVVQNVGDHTFYGQLAGELQEDNVESPLRVRLTHLASTLSKIGYFAAFLVAVADLFNDIVIGNSYQMPLIISELTSLPLMMTNLFHAGMLAISVIVVAVPEGLPMMITVVLSSNMFRMLKDNVMVRKLIGIETAGSLNILYSDKTGTLTKGILTASTLTTGDGKEFTSAAELKKHEGIQEIVRLSCLYNTSSLISKGQAIGGNATDRALLDYVLSSTPKKEQKNISQTDYKKLETVLFDSANKYSMVHIKGDRDLILVKGAPEILLDNCKEYYTLDGHRTPLTDRKKLIDKWKMMTREGIRVLVLATADKNGIPSQKGFPLCFLCLVGIRDELRPEIHEAVTNVNKAGIQTVMITGDNRDTAVSIAKEAGILTSSQDKVLTSGEMASMADKDLKRILPNLRVVARALPTDKSRLVRISQELGLVVGMTGDGINDAPALKKADVGFAMGSGTEVAKEASEIVILDNNFASITKAILYGRTIFKSIRKFIVFQLTMNICAVGVSVIAPFLGVEAPVTVIQMLWINIIMDTLAGLAFAGEPPLKEYMHEPPKKRDEKILNKDMMNQIIYMGIYTIIICIAFLTMGHFKEMFRYEQGPIYFLTAFFALFIFAGIFNSFNARTHRINIFSHLGKNPTFLLIMGLVSVVQIVMIYYGGSLFRTAGLTGAELKYILLISATVIPVDFIRKLILRSRKRHAAL